MKWLCWILTFPLVAIGAWIALGIGSPLAMTWLRWILTLLLVAIGSWIALWNWKTIVGSAVNPRGKHESWIPLAGGLLVSVGFLIPPDDDLRRLWWLPLMVDWGCAPGMLATGIFHVWSLRRSRVSGS